MKTPAINDAPSNGYKKTNRTAKAAVILTCLLTIALAGNAMNADTTDYNDGCRFCRWLWDMIDCIDENDKFDTQYMKQQGYDYYYPEVPDFDKLAESIVKSMDKDGDNAINQKEFFDKNLEILEQQGQDYSYEEEQNMKNIVLTPLFKSLDYIGSPTDRINGTNTLNKKEIAGNLYALSKRNLRDGHFSGCNVTEEFLNVMYNYELTGQSQSKRASYK